MNKDFEEILFTEKQLKERTIEIGKLIDKKYGNKEIVVLGLLKGAYVFTADVARAIKNPNVTVEFMVVSSYKNGKSLGALDIKLDVKHPIKNKDVIIVEDIVDTGITLSTIKKLLLGKGARTVEIAAMCTKPSRREAYVQIDYPSFVIANKIVVGYGLDYNGKYRHLPYVATLTQEAFDKYKKGENDE